MNNFISLHFSTKGVDFETEIKPKLEELIKEIPSQTTLVHAFASRKFLNNKGINTEVIDFFEEKFGDRQINFFRGEMPMRELMFSFMAGFGAKSYFLTPTTEGLTNVDAEKEAAIKLGVETEEIVLN